MHTTKSQLPKTLSSLKLIKCSKQCEHILKMNVGCVIYQDVSFIIL